MELTRKLDDKFSNLSENIFNTFGESYIGTGFSYFLCWILVVIYVITLYCELAIGVTVFRHKINIEANEWGEVQLNDEEKEWLNKNINRGYWKLMIQDFSGDFWLVENRSSEVRFLRKKDALVYKMVWG